MQIQAVTEHPQHSKTERQLPEVLVGPGLHQSRQMAGMDAFWSGLHQHQVAEVQCPDSRQPADNTFLGNTGGFKQVWEACVGCIFARLMTSSMQEAQPVLHSLRSSLQLKNIANHARKNKQASKLNSIATSTSARRRAVDAPQSVPTTEQSRIDDSPK